MKRLKRLLSLSIAIVLIVVMLNPVSASAANTVERIRVYSLSVGQGDCQIIQFVMTAGNSEYVLIDTGNQNKDLILQFIKQKNIKEFKYVILTHFDGDHSGQLSYILANKDLTVKNYVMRKFTAATLASLKTYENTFGFKIYTRYQTVNELIKAKEGNLDKIIFPRRSLDNILTVGDNIEIEFFDRYTSFFDDGLSAVPTENQLGLASNNDSLVFCVRAKGSNKMRPLMFTGDVRPGGMNMYLQNANFMSNAKNAGFFTFPHHGMVNLLNGNDSKAADKLTRDAFISNLGQNAVTFVSCPNNATILAGRPSGSSIYDFFDAIRMRNMTDGYFHTSNLAGLSGQQTALKYTVEVATGAFGVKSYPDNILLQ